MNKLLLTLGLAVAFSAQVFAQSTFTTGGDPRQYGVGNPGSKNRW